MQILEETGINWRERRLINKFYMDQCVKVGYDWTKGRHKVWRLDEELDKVAAYHRFYSANAVNTLAMTLYKGWETSNWNK
jgi:hypothetical protein